MLFVLLLSLLPSPEAGRAAAATAVPGDAWGEIFRMMEEAGEGDGGVPMEALFPDPAMRGAVEAAARAAAGKPEGALAVADLALVTELNLGGMGIRDVAPLKDLTGLTSLDLSGNQIEDVRPLAKLKKLTSLDLSDNRLADIAPLEKLSGLRELFLSGNGIVDTSPLWALSERGCYIVLRGNPTTQVLPSAPTPAPTPGPTPAPSPEADPEYLELREGDSGLRVTALQNRLYELGYYAGEADGFYGESTALAVKRFEGAYRKAVTGIATVPLLKTLFSDTAKPSESAEAMSSAPPEQTAQVIRFADPNMEKAVRAALRKPEGALTVEDAAGVTHLSLDSKGIETIWGIQYFLNIKELTLYNNRISDISALSGLASLEKLYAGRNQIKDIGPLSGLVKLKKLSLTDNEIVDIVPLAGLTDLEVLQLNTNRISNIKVLSGLRNLKMLWLGDNAITDYRPVAPYYDQLENTDFFIE